MSDRPALPPGMTEADRLAAACMPTVQFAFDGLFARSVQSDLGPRWGPWKLRVSKRGRWWLERHDLWVGKEQRHGPFVDKAEAERALAMEVLAQDVPPVTP